MSPVRGWASLTLEHLAVAATYAVLALQFCAAYFPLDDTKLGGPGDFEPYAAVDWMVVKYLSEYGEFPMWNRLMHTGLPAIGDAYLSFFNPAVLIPLWVWGPTNGAKIAVVVAVALSGIGQYWLGRVFGHGRCISLIAGVLGLTAGTLVARVSSGFNLAQSLQHAWMAPTLASYIVALRTGRPSFIALAAVCYAMLFHAGNVYLWLVLSFVMAIFAAGYAIQVPAQRPWWRHMVNPRPAAAAAAVVALGALLDAPQGLPMVEMRAFADKPIDIAFRGTQPILPTLFSFVIADKRFWQGELLGANPLGWGVHYSYVGASLFIFLLLLLPAAWRFRSRDVPLLVISVAFTIAWAAARHTFMYELWQRWDVMRQLRFWSTATHVTTILLIPLALYGAEYAWQRLIEWRPKLDALRLRVDLGWLGVGARRMHRRRRASVGLVGPALWGVLLWALVRAAHDPWVINRREWNTPPFPTGAEQVFAWLRAHDPGVYFVHNHENFFVSYANTSQIRFEIPVLNSVWLFTPRLTPTPGAPDGGLLTPAAKYIVAPRTAPPLPGTQLVQELPHGSVYLAPPGLPFAFLVDPQRLPYGRAAGAVAVAAGQVLPVDVQFDGPNRIVTRIPASIPSGMTHLVIMQSFSEGWRVSGPSGAVTRLGGFLSVSGVAAGGEYRLSFMPRSFVVGSVLGVVGVIAVVTLVGVDTVRSRGGRAP